MAKNRPTANQDLGPIRWGEWVDGKFRGLVSDMDKVCRACNDPLDVAAPSVHTCKNRELGQRFNKGKIRYDLIPAKPLQELAGVMTYGANKYSDRNWEMGLPYMETVASIMRHLYSWVIGETHDKESGYHHLAHAAFGCFALIEFYYTGKGLDDRVIYPSEVGNVSDTIDIPVQENR